MSQLPYSPMRAPEKHVTQEDMWETLKKHAQSEVELQLSKREGQTPKAELPVRKPLKWQKAVKTGEISGYMLSADGAFSVSKDSVRGKPMYSAWKRDTDPATNLGVRLTLLEAQHLCELAR